MAFHVSDKVLWICLGVSLFFAVRGIAADLHSVNELTEIKNDGTDDKIISEGTEDALKLDTLLRLSNSTSYDLRSAALRIIAERSVKANTRNLLLKDLASKNPERRNKAIPAVFFLVSNRALSRTSVCSRLKDFPTYTALVDCLCNLLGEHVEKTSDTVSPIFPRTRPPGEIKAMRTLNILLQENTPAALEAGIVSRWLANYPFPCALTEPSRRQDVVILMKTWWADDAVMSAIFGTLSSHPEGAKQLRKYGLMGSMLEENDHDELSDDNDDGDEESDVWMVDGDDTAGSRPIPARRHRDRNIEEQALRRRRREAMVLSDGRRPIGNDDIIQFPIAN
ncbi:hypothetical protein ASPSYDRAFT_86843 [Aspergillus sydowii CBS 593.65]|uniref:Uncharacterized protein n=1 Tax=Aspergillus sydowii CBS 593.65 TaxID=1036612 RepID=A0A1L9TUW2_9EURO|nr:uncharacterized protein ASPSYDRAFT_86843 [Aspergillus sydowii CBS 593.65]OJJ63201.1 hypothetical protein ASPSYDRAFT_86843 [Aspergillus sydowii CBS 593.65]